MYYYTYRSPVGALTIFEENDQIGHLYFEKKIDPKNCIEFESGILKEAAKQLNEYFFCKRKVFDLPLNPHGTEFMLQVWDELCKIPYGTTASYKDISRAIGHPKSYRAVGLANNRNPLPIFIPCHRVIAADGNICGYGGGIKTKQFLLDLEKTEYKL